MSSADSLTLYIHRLRSPDVKQREEAARILWERFAPRLQVVVRRHLDHRIFRREDEQDILQSMFASFFRGQLRGSMAPASREELWKLLVRITMCKVINTANRHLAERRDIRRERSGTLDADREEAILPRWILDHVDRGQPSAEEKLVVAEEFQRLLKRLPEKLRRIVIWKFEGYTNAEIACFLDRTVRSVELKLQLIRRLLQEEATLEAARLERERAPGVQPDSSSPAEQG